MNIESIALWVKICGAWSKIAGFMKKMWDSPYQLLRTIIVIVISVLFASLLSANSYRRETTIAEMYREDILIERINRMLYELKDSVFITRIRYEQSDESGVPDKFYFKNALGLIGGKIINLKQYNPIYLMPHEADENTKSFLRNLPSPDAIVVTDSLCKIKGYTSISNIIKRQNLPIDRFKIALVKDINGVVWAFTLSCFNNKKITDDINSPYFGYGSSQLSEIASSEQDRINSINYSFFAKKFNLK